MQAIEFIVESKDDTIKIPKKYVASLLGNKIRVIILTEEVKSVPKKSIDKKSPKKFTALKVNTKGLKVDREKANVRQRLL